MYTKDDTNRVKGVAILLLIFHHMYRTVEDIVERGVELNLLSDVTVSKMAYCFRICVYIFAILTAYGVTLQYKKIMQEKGSTLKFLIVRWIKLLSPFWFTLVCLWLIFWIVPTLNPLITYADKPLKYMIGDFFCILDITGYSGNMFSGVFLVYEFCNYRISFNSDYLCHM